MKVIKKQQKRSLQEVYPDAFVRFLNKSNLAADLKYDQMEKDELIKYIFLGIKSINVLHKNIEQKKDIDLLFSEYSIINNIVLALTYITPRELLQIFPAMKTYDGAKYETKDYYYSIEVMKKAGLDETIKYQEKTREILLDFMNIDIRMFVMAWVSCANDINYLGSGKNLLDEFLAENGINTYYRQGKYLINNKTGERIRIKQKKKRASQFKIIKNIEADHV